MKILNKIMESIKTEDYEISSVEDINKKIRLIVFVDGSSVEIQNINGKYQITSVNQYNDDENMSEKFLEDIEWYRTVDQRDEEIRDILKKIQG